MAAELKKWCDIPDGMVLVKKGGRPKSDARNIAVLMTRIWRTEILGESKKNSDAWTLEHWGNKNGISEDSTIRRAIRAAEAGPLLGYIFFRMSTVYDPRTGNMNFDGKVRIEARQDEPQIGSMVWTWRESLKTASSYVLDVPQFTFVEVNSF